ncbi:hypothetical protein C8K38_11379 [Rhodococcus sp. OK611]|uniref:hypothetical protein n=1 Tax=unclassified Rhodococcus (in: high G+C Gram-positive bacteria) TaxID=192944 RepID=UPI000BCEBCDB|nr:MULTISPECIES: hypothetical protein [unclassified Rhodococcus (in: high G+C Gram-positive bacteria)]PTR40553.1 hypothetical protein C8K38_11379 [Rhodococcus sp. OK611]SNX92244.1 hypothetical protein SAMN05447004_11379 [Rhodococcus sp. OK270]
MSNRNGTGSRFLALVAALAVFGLAAGVLGAIGWRHATPYADYSPTEPNGRLGVRTIYYGFMYFPGPPWLPALLIFPAVGATMLAAVGALVGLSGWRLVRRGGGGRGPLFAVFVICGLVYGAIVALVGGIHPPQLGQPFALDRTPTGDPTTASLPWHIDLGPTWLSFPAIGLALGLIIAIALSGTGIRLVRRDASVPVG